MCGGVGGGGDCQGKIAVSPGVSVPLISKVQRSAIFQTDESLRRISCCSWDGFCYFSPICYFHLFQLDFSNGEDLILGTMYSRDVTPFKKSEQRCVFQPGRVFSGSGSRVCLLGLEIKSSVQKGATRAPYLAQGWGCRPQASCHTFLPEPGAGVGGVP